MYNDCMFEIAIAAANYYSTMAAWCGHTNEREEEFNYWYHQAALHGGA